MVEMRYELAIDRIRDIPIEKSVPAPFDEYFGKLAEFVLMIDELRVSFLNSSWNHLTTEELAKWNKRLYEDILPGNYDISYANPAYAIKKLGEDHGAVLSFLYAEIRSAIVYAFENKTEYLDILFELFIEVYNQFEDSSIPDAKSIRNIIYWYASDYCDVFVADRIREQVCPEESFAADIIMNSDLDDIRYLYQFGEYVSRNEIETAKFLISLPEEEIQKMADVYTEGYRKGFINTGKDLSKKSVVNIRYVLGFEKVIKAAILNFEKMGLQPVIYRSGVSVLTKRQHMKIGYYGAIANKQYEYDHRNDQALFFDKKFVERKLEVIMTAYEHLRKEARQVAGPALMDVFGEEPFTPVNKPEVIRLTEKQEELVLKFDSRQSQITNKYIPGDERSFTIIAYPVPEIGEDFREIFEETIRINTLDAELYEKVQQTIIDALDQGEYVHILGGNGNRTDLKVALYPLTDPEKETKFENCVADVNIPVGEVFTSPVLEGTNGVLHVSKVYLNELQYKDLEMTFSNGMIADYNCGNFERELENKEYVHENVLYKHPTLPLGEFAIGTNTTAYVVAKKYGIEDKMPILIAEKMGPHFAVGDTCYTWSEDIKVYNPNGKEIVAKANSVSKEKYFHCHTDITIPYEELKQIAVVKEDGTEILILENGRFVLEGTEILNEPLKKINK